MALLPIGLIAIYQTSEVVEEVRKRSELSLLAMTEHAATEERQVVEHAFGAAQALGVVLQLIREDPIRCQQYLERYLNETEMYSFIGLQRTDGVIRCSSVTQEFDFSGSAGFQDLIENPRPYVDVNLDAPISQTSVLIIMQPFFVDDEFNGYVSVSVPHSTVSEASDRIMDRTPLELITFNANGDILTAEGGFDNVEDHLPDGIELAELVGQKPNVFSGVNRNGQEREFAVVPIVPGVVFALGTWSPNIPLLTNFNSIVSPMLFAVVMWVASLIVAYFSVHRLVVRHINQLGTQMRRFAQNRRLPDLQEANMMPLELLDMQKNFQLMAYSLMEEEAQLEDSVREKNVLLKEVHHRVKNNLQLISSIMNMQMRKTSNQETIDVVKRLQDRVLGLATIHRNLYQTENLSQVDASILVKEITNQLLVVGEQPGATIDVQTDLDQIVLYPDQAVPMSLLLSEAITNAIKYVGTETNDERWIKVHLELIDTVNARLVIINSKGSQPPVLGKTGLGSQLIQAFARQLEGSITIEETDEAYQVKVEFPVSEFIDAPLDY